MSRKHQYRENFNNNNNNNAYSRGSNINPNDPTSTSGTSRQGNLPEALANGTPQGLGNACPIHLMNWVQNQSNVFEVARGIPSVKF